MGAGGGVIEERAGRDQGVMRWVSFFSGEEHTVGGGGVVCCSLRGNHTVGGADAESCCRRNRKFVLKKVLKILEHHAIGASWHDV